MAPEIHEVKNNREKTYDAPKVDIFALGVILFAVVFGKLPFEFAVESDKLYQLIRKKEFAAFWSRHKAESF